MAMSLAALEILEEAQFPPAQARALARVLEIEFVGSRDVLATKTDLTELALTTKADLAQVKADLAQFASTTKADLAQLASTTKTDLAQFASINKADLAELRQAVALEMSRVEGRLEVKIESVKAECVRWTFLAIIGQATLLAGVMYFLLQYVR